MTDTTMQIMGHDVEVSFREWVTISEITNIREFMEGAAARIEELEQENEELKEWKSTVKTCVAGS